MFDEGGWLMQNHRQRIKPHLAGNHHLERLAKPYLIWLYIFACFPVIIMFCLMFVDTEGIKFQNMQFTMANFGILGARGTLIAFWNSLKYSLITTILCIFFGYLLAYSLYKSKIKNRYLVLLLLILPMWTNVILRINALASIFLPQNILVDLFHLPGLNILGTGWAILLGMVFTYLPFIVLPIYTSLEKIDPSLEEAALDLGVTNFIKFWKVIVPLSVKGLVSGSMMVLLPCISGFAIPKVLGSGNIPMIGYEIEQNFITMSYNQGAVLAIILLIVILGSILLINTLDKEGETLI